MHIWLIALPLLLLWGTSLVTDSLPLFRKCLSLSQKNWVTPNLSLNQTKSFLQNGRPHNLDLEGKSTSQDLSQIARLAELSKVDDLALALTYLADASAR